MAKLFKMLKKVDSPRVYPYTEALFLRKDMKIVEMTHEEILASNTASVGEYPEFIEDLEEAEPDVTEKVLPKKITIRKDFVPATKPVTKKVVAKKTTPAKKSTAAKISAKSPAKSVPVPDIEGVNPDEF